MARQNYKAEKRRRELEKKRKKEAKLEKRLNRSETGDESDAVVDENGLADETSSNEPESDSPSNENRD